MNIISNYYELIIWLIFLFLFLFTASVFFYFIYVQWLLQGKKPIKYYLDDLVADYPFLSMCDFLPEVQNNEKEQIQEYDTNELSVITTAPEKELVPSWYVSYRTEEIGLPFAYKQMLDETIAKTFQVCNKMEIKDVSVDICAVLIGHLKEYKKALKRYETTPDRSIETLYKKTHSIYNSNKKQLPVDHCTNVLRIILKELVPWDLWDTPWSELLVRVLSKKLDMFIENTISDPIWLNDRLLNILKENEDTKDDKEQTKNLTVENHENTDELKPKASHFNKNEGIVKEKEIKEEVQSQNTDPVEIEPAAILSQKLGRQDRNEVKKYDKIIEVIAESLICSWLEDQSTWVKEQMFAYIKQLSKPADANVDKKLCEFDIDRTCQIVLDKLPETYLFSQLSEKALSQAVKLIVSSFSHREVNKDVIFRTIDIFAVHIQKCAQLLNMYYV